MSDWHTLTGEETAQRLQSDPRGGLDEAEVRRRRAEFGPNELKEQSGKSTGKMVWEQLSATLVLLLILAAAISAALGDYRDTIVILIIVALNAALGFIQEYRALKAMAALKWFAAPKAKVQRGGRLTEVPARDLVPGDVVLLEAGNLIPADYRVLESVNLRTHEAALTGESAPIDKNPGVIAGMDLALADRYNMVFMGTVAVYGRGRAMVTETGTRTTLGGIATMLQTVNTEATPLQGRLNQLGRGLAGVVVVLAALIFTLGLARGESARLMFLTAVSLAVAAVPEGLPAVVTIALALGAQRMLRRRALIRSLPAVETLGSVTVICSDKTGTLTENRMTVAFMDVAGHRLELLEDLARNGVVADQQGEFAQELSERPALVLLLTGGALCNDASLESDTHPGVRITARGDATEAALVVAAAHFGLRKGALEKLFPRIAEIPFDSERKRMTTLHTVPDSIALVPDALRNAWTKDLSMVAAHRIAFTKGAVDMLLEKSGYVWVDSGPQPFTRQWRDRLWSVHDQLANSGMRLIGVALRPLGTSSGPGQPLEAVENGLIFVGMISMVDPPRPEVKQAIRICKRAGIRPVMITGDHALTAQYVARELDMAGESRLLTGAELGHLSARELEERVDQIGIYARVSPDHKLRIVQALQRRGHIVAMTGDGVNDAPALKKADIGVAMGVSGTDVSKDAADMILLDDNFATIVAAVQEGRAIYDNIRKFIKYLMTTNSGELWVMLLAPFLGMPLPLLPVQILWINLISDGLPGLALSVEPPERDTMRRPPYPPAERIFARGMGRHIVWVGWLIGLVSLGIGYGSWRQGHLHWQTLLFTTLALSQMAHVLAIRSSENSLFSIGLLSNPYLFLAVIATLGLQLIVVYTPFCQEFFRTGALSAADLAVSLLLGSVVFWAVELEKWTIRRRQHRAGGPCPTKMSLAPDDSLED